MTDEPCRDHDRLIRLEERVRAGETALGVQQRASEARHQAILSTVLASLAFLAAIAAVIVTALH